MGRRKEINKNKGQECDHKVYLCHNHSLKSLYYHTFVYRQPHSLRGKVLMFSTNIVSQSVLFIFVPQKIFN